MNQDPFKYYNTELEKAKFISGTLKKHIAYNSMIRLLSFLLSFVCFFGLLKLSIAAAVVSFVLLFSLFLGMVKRHLTLQKKKNYIAQIIAICTKELAALNHNFKDFRTGNGYQDPQHAFSYDLDVFGKGSIFQLINRTVTQKGEELLMSKLVHEQLSPESIKSEQNCIQEIALEPEFLVRYRATGQLSGYVDEDRQKIKKWLESDSFVSNRPGLKITTFILIFLIVFALIISIINEANTPFLILMFFVNLGFVGFNIKRINKEHTLVGSLLKMLNKYSDLLSVIEEVQFKSELWKQSIIKNNERSNSSASIIRRLTKIVGGLDNRLNFAISIVLEAFLLWDYQYLFRLDKWKRNYGENLSSWMEQVALVDYLVSCSTFAYNHPDFIYPTPSTKYILKAENLGHPLILSSVRICNDFMVKKKGDFVMITGANMAGKSTFLRTIGVNLILAKIGLPVCASAFEFKPMKMYTSMRTTDSLNENESYFYAELKRLKFLINKLEMGDDYLIILDEILKGTNSIDKQRGSRSALEKIIRLKGTGVIATHDLALTEIESKFQDNVKNQCFEIEIDGDKIRFDYKLYDGVTKKMNAMLLMEQMGIV